MSLNPTTIGGYELKNCVASGATTQIWEVTQAGSALPLAMKLLLPDSLKDPQVKNVLKHEFKVGSSFEHPNLVRFHKIEITRDHGFFIMDYFRAPSLKAQTAANVDAELQSDAAAIGVDWANLEACMNDPQTDTVIRAQADQGHAAGVRGTPAIYVNGKSLDLAALILSLNMVRERLGKSK